MMAGTVVRLEGAECVLKIVSAQPYKGNPNPDPNTQTQSGHKRWRSVLGQHAASSEGTLPSSPEIGRTAPHLKLLDLQLLKPQLMDFQLLDLHSSTTSSSFLTRKKSGHLKN